MILISKIIHLNKSILIYLYYIIYIYLLLLFLICFLFSFGDWGLGPIPNLHNIEKLNLFNTISLI